MKLTILIPILLILTGCSALIPIKKQVDVSQRTIAIQEKKVAETTDSIVKNEKNKKIQTSSLSTGIQYSLSQVTNPPVQVVTANALNDRVISIVGSPHLDEIKRIKATVDLLNSEIESERKKGEALLLDRDEIIIKLQKEKSDLKEKYDDDIQDMTNVANKIAKGSDEKQATIEEMGGMFGLNAVFWGVKKFFFSCLTVIIVGLVIFIILRLLSTMNPIAGAVFSVFNMVGSIIVSLLKTLVPKSFEMCNFVSTSHHDKFKNTLVKIVDVIQDLKEKRKNSSDKIYPLSDILERFDKDMDESDKKLINSILVEQKWMK